MSRNGVLLLVAIVAALSSGFAEAKAGTAKSTPPGLAKKGGVPPGQAKRGCLPPGLARKFGSKAPCGAYVAADPKVPSQAWFLIEGEWVLRTGFEASVQAEISSALKLALPPPPPPPIPLPKIAGTVEILLFGD